MANQGRVFAYAYRSCLFGSALLALYMTSGDWHTNKKHSYVDGQMGIISAATTISCGKCPRASRLTPSIGSKLSVRQLDRPYTKYEHTTIEAATISTGAVIAVWNQNCQPIAKPAAGSMYLEANSMKPPADGS